MINRRNILPLLPLLLPAIAFSIHSAANGLDFARAAETSERDREKTLRQELTAIDVSTLKGLSEVVERLANKSIVYVGEVHDRFSHHQVQLQILEGLYRKHARIAIGMESFQRPFQKALDDYIAGTIDERAFLKRSEYFKRWDMDYNLYKPILDFAKARRIPVVALNLQREIVNKVSTTGLESLNADEKSQIPQELDFTDQDYRARLEQAFKEHQNFQQKNFDFFHQAQILWDETMAESIDRFLRNNPDFRMVIFAGAGHLQYGSGIPKRSFRRNGREYAIVLSDAEIQRGIADFIVFPAPAQARTAPRLMIFVNQHNQTVRVTGFAKDSVAERAGLEKDDALLSLDGYPVNSIEDIKIALLYKNPGDTLRVKVKRSRRTADEELEFEIKLP
ncbi:MAG: ChaN family lipoprotein [Candidatus Binatia bacterium]